MDEFLYPWQSHIMKAYPWVMPLFLLILALVLSIVTWIKQKK